MSSALFYEWRAKFGAMDAPIGSEMKAMADHGRATNACPPGIFFVKSACEEIAPSAAITLVLYECVLPF